MPPPEKIITKAAGELDRSLFARERHEKKRNNKNFTNYFGFFV